MRIIRFITLFALLPCLLVHAAGVEVGWQDCAREAAEQNQRLQAARQNINRAMSDKKSVDSAYYPSVSASAGASLGKTENVQQKDASSYGLSANQTIYDFGRTGAQSKRSSAAVESAENKYRLTSATVRYKLRNAYIDALKTQQALDINNRIIERRQKSAKLIKLRYEAGREHKGSLLTSEAKQTQAELQKNKVQRALENARYALAVELGRDRNADDGWNSMSVKGELAVEGSYVVSPDFEAILDTTPDMKDLVIQSRIARFDVDAAKSEFYPSLGISAGMSDVSSDWDDYIYGWDARLSLSLPIFEGGRNRARYDSAKAGLAVAGHNEFTGRSDLAAELRRRWSILQDAVDQMKLQKQFHEAAKERARISQVQYASGIINYDSWIIIEDEDINSEQSLLEANAAAMAAEAEWINVKGGTLEEDIR